MSLHLRVITPDKTVWDGKVEEIILPSTTGQLGILSNHAPLLSALDTGVMRIRSDKEWKNIALMGGFAEVENNEVKVLVNGAQIGENVDKDAARSEFNEAQTRFDAANSGADLQEQIQAKQALKRARALYQASGGMVS
jgi:F-type H+-transporting ATPase subunit epsilon